MANTTNFVDWFNQLTGDDPQRVAAKKAGLIESTLSRQISRGTFRPEMVIALCRGYNRSPVTGLIETGYLQACELDGVSVPYALREATNEQLLDEIMRRSDPEARELFTADGDDAVVDIDDNVVDFPSMSDPGGTIPEGAVADSSPDEDALRKDGDWTDPDNIP